jgi:hypothetical protein
MKTRVKADKGVAGLTILLSLVTMLFVIGLLVMIFSLMGGQLRDATYTSTDVAVSNETGVNINATGHTLIGASSLNAGSFVLTEIRNATAVYLVGNATVSDAGVITNATSTTFTNVNVSYTYNYDAENTATGVINDTTAGISGVTDWYPIFIVIGAMVVLILLTVIIITAIRESGLMAGESA